MKKGKRNTTVFFTGLIVLILIVFASIFVYYKFGKEEKKKSNDTEYVEVQDDEIVEASIKPFASEEAIILNIDGVNYGMVLENNLTAYDLYSVLPLELTMDDLNNNEKYTYLSFSLYEAGDYTGRIQKGDVMLYQSNCIVIFYQDFDTDLHYTKIGHIDNLGDLGTGSIKVSIN